MASRLGNVLYWTACTGAFLWLAVVFAAATMRPQPEWGVFWVAGPAPSLIIWLIGRAARYVLSAA